MGYNMPQNEYDEVIFVGDSTQIINIEKNKANENEILESKEYISCVFCFKYQQNEYGKAMRNILLRMLYTDEIEKCDNQLFYTDDCNSVFKIYIHADSNSILELANKLSQSLPLGLNFTFKNIEPISDSDFMQEKRNNEKEIKNLKEQEKVLIKNSTLHIPNVLELHALLDKTDKTYREISPFVKLENCNIPCFIQSYNNQNTLLLQKEQLQDFIKNKMIESLADKIMQDKKITMQRNNTIFTLSLNPIESTFAVQNTPFILFSTLDMAQRYLRMNESQKSMLASFEKPFIKMQCKDVFAKELGAYTVFAGLSHDIVVLLLLSYLQNSHEKDYLFYHNMQDSMQHLEAKDAAIIQYKDVYPQRDNIESHSYIVAENIYINHLQTHHNLSALLEYNKTDKTRFIAFLSTQHSSAFLIQNPQNKDISLKQILNISFSTDLYSHLKVLHGYKNGDRLIYNFAKENKEIVEKWHLQQEELETLGISDIISHTDKKSSDIKFTNNLLDIYGLISKILDIDTSVLFEANRCVRDRGPRIDYKLIRQDDCIVLDYARVLRSVMSFKLAGVETELLCYGVVDSLAEFIGTLSGDMLLNYGIQEVFVCGDLLLWQCFLDKIVKAIPKNMNSTFPQFGGTDYLS